MRPATTALLDQADAATTQAARIMATIAALDGTPVQTWPQKPRNPRN
jgi:hypothetical protein